MQGTPHLFAQAVNKMAGLTEDSTEAQVRALGARVFKHNAYMQDEFAKLFPDVSYIISDPFFMLL